MSANRSFRLPEDLDRAINKEVERRGVTRNALAEAAFRSFLTPEGADRRDEAILFRLDQVSRGMGRLSRDNLIISETLALFVRYFLTVTPPVPDDDQDAARALGFDRFEHFVAQLAQRIAGGRTLLKDVLDEIRPVERDFFSVADFANNPETDDTTLAAAPPSPACPSAGDAVTKNDDA